MSEVSLNGDAPDVIAGFEVSVECEDTPSPALAFYYDANFCFAGLLDLAD